MCSEINMTKNEIIDVVTDVLNDIINETKTDFNDDRGDYKVSYEGEKFYLARISGNYEYSLQALIQLILHESGVFSRILNEEQVVEVQESLSNDPTTIYMPDELYDLLGSIYYYSMAFVGKKLTVLGFNVEDDFVNEGWWFVDSPCEIKDKLLSRIENNTTTLEVNFIGEATAENITQFVTEYLNNIINKSQKYFEEDGLFVYNFSTNNEWTIGYLDGLHELTFSIMINNCVFKQILDDNQLNEFHENLNKYLEEGGEFNSIYSLTDNKSYNELKILFEKIDYESINFVYNKLSKWGYDLGDEYTDYLNLHKTKDTTASTEAIKLIINDQEALSIESDVEIGKQQLQSFHPEAHYYSDPQFRLFKTDAGWNIEHDETAINETIVNGVKLTEPLLIADGMVISVGNAAKGIHKLPIILKLLKY